MKKGVKVIPLFELLHTKIYYSAQPADDDEGHNPVGIARELSSQGADEIAFIDVDQVRLGFKVWEDIIKELKETVDIPIIFGNSMNAFDEFEVALETGVDRVAIDVFGDTDHSMVDILSSKYGSERIVVAVGGKKNPPESGRPEFELVERCGCKPTGMNLIEWLKMAEFFGVGMVILTSYDTAGAGKGYDIEMTRAVTSAISVPVIAVGGAGKLEHFYQVINEAGAAGVGATSVFKSGILTPLQIKKYLADRGVGIAK
ncbi:MAG: HisA/HisF-related TIM barrel protein [Dehalococcoidales bacterium]|nr:HisA/HisF-related TIM barrel protein [Dehalococcoidales bacterium]MDD3265428.1 HisA/HisF-related TIM barrel protein [Dehalococcoidales bacterium]